MATNRKCWAECLGNCSDTLSGEHIVSKGLFIDDMVGVQGLSWCKDEAKIIGLNNLTRNILCDRHNNALSPADEAAVRAFDIYRKSVQLTDVRNHVKEQRWRIVRFSIDGDGLERWFLKTLINIAFGGREKIGPKSNTPGEPSPDLVEIAHGIRNFSGNAGLHSSAEVGEQINSEDRVTIIPFFDANNEYLLGSTFYFRGFRFMLHLGEEGFTGNVKFIHKDGRGVSQYSKPARHPAKLRVIVGPSQKYVSHIIEFEWS